MKCGKCKGPMKKKENKLFGEKIQVYFCDKCENKLIPINEAIKIQVMRWI